MSAPELVYEDELVRLWCGDGLDWMSSGGPLTAADVVVTDPPYGETSLEWDRPVDGWQEYAACLAVQCWCFGSLRSILADRDEFENAGWKFAQEVVWHKHNGSGFHTDRFKRVHELAVHWYQGKWGELHLDTPVTLDATARTIRKKGRPTHTGHIDATPYASEDGGPRLMRSVQYVRSEHGRAVHPTQKPLGILRPLITYSTPPGGLVVDPFAGSGSTLIAARETGRRAEGCEINPAYCEAAIRRLSQQTLGMEAA